MVLNKEVYVAEKDNLIYDMSHPKDAKLVPVSLPEGAGEVKRGQVIDYADGKYTIHASGGFAAAIAAETIKYAESDTEMPVPVYTSGTFRTSACVSDAELATVDIENLRSKGIYLK